ncbi:hypothetical protein [Oceanobacillus sp. FSL H7-0719]|uniref:hypothetical protein n=1 Tax=Oceanobacillus sp. FSL H7-0719 TaxID=2954507 RepID=UPI003247773A
MAYKTTKNKEFKEKGLYNREEVSIISTNKKTAGVEFSIIEALEKLSANGDEIEITIKRSEVSESLDGEELDGE